MGGTGTQIVRGVSETAHSPRSFVTGGPARGRNITDCCCDSLWVSPGFTGKENPHLHSDSPQKPEVPSAVLSCHSW